MFSLEIIIPIIVVAAVCAVYIILRGRRDERRAREAGEKLRMHLVQNFFIIHLTTGFVCSILHGNRTNIHTK